MSRMIYDKDQKPIRVEGVSRAINDRKQAEEDINKVSRQYLSMIDNVPGIIYRCINNKDWTISFISDAVESLTGYSAFDFLDFPLRSFQDIIHPDDRDYVTQSIYTAVKEKKAWNIEYRINHKIGEVRWMQERGRAIQDKGGTIASIDGFIIDITDRKKADDQLKFQALVLNQITDRVTVTDLEGRINYVNEAEVQALGLERDELIGESTEKFGEDAERGATQQQIIEQTLLCGKWRGEIVNRSVDGRERILDCRTQVIYDSEGEPKALCGISTDITEQKRAEEAIIESEARFRLLFEESPVSIIIHDKDTGEILDANENAYRSYGLSSLEELKANDFWVDPPYSVNEALQFIRKAATEGVQHLEWKNRNIQGETFWERVTLRLVVIGGIERVLSVSTDITALKRAEEEKNKQLAEKETLLLEVHHRIKNNMASVQGLLLLQANSIENPEAKQALKDSIARVQSMYILYDKLLLSRDYRTIMLRPYIEGLIDSIVAVYIVDKNIILEKQILDFSISSKRAIYLGIIINELLTNAFKYAFKDRENGIVSIRIDEAGNNLVLIIQDDGAGFEASKSPGLGLTIVNMLIEQLNGTYKVIYENGTKNIIQFEI